MEKSKTEADVPFEQSSDSSRSGIPRGHQTPFGDHDEGKGVMVEPRSVLILRVEKGESSVGRISSSRRSLKQIRFSLSGPLP